MIHVLQNGIEAVLVDERIDEVDALIVGGDLRPQITLDIAETPSSTAAGVLRWLLNEDPNELVSLVISLVDDLERNDGGAFFEEGLGCRGHRAGQNSTDVCVRLRSAGRSRRGGTGGRGREERGGSAEDTWLHVPAW